MFYKIIIDCLISGPRLNFQWSGNEAVRKCSSPSNIRNCPNRKTKFCIPVRERIRKEQTKWTSFLKLWNCFEIFCWIKIKSIKLLNIMKMADRIMCIVYQLCCFQWNRQKSFTSSDFFNEKEKHLFWSVKTKHWFFWGNEKCNFGKTWNWFSEWKHFLEYSNECLKTLLFVSWKKSEIFRQFMNVFHHYFR